MKKYRIIPVLALLLLSPVSNAATYTQSTLSAAAAAINKSLPTMVDSVTKFTTVTVDTSTFRYHYIITNVKSTDMDAAKFNAAMRTNLSKLVCVDQFAKQVFDSGFNISFDYNGNDNKPITSIVFKPGDCSKQVRN
jgi:hypothetical protein